jgi:Lon protease-like protein
VGTIAQIVQAGRLPDGRWALATVGTERVAVREWLADDPYPRARVALLVEPEPTRDAGAAVDDVQTRLARVHALRVQLGLPAHGGDILLSPDLVRASFESAILAPLGPLDAQTLLEIDDAVDRLEHLAALLASEIELLEFRLSG